MFEIEAAEEAGYIDCIIAAMTKYPDTQGVQARRCLSLLPSRTAPVQLELRRMQSDEWCLRSGHGCWFGRCQGCAQSGMS